MVFHWAITAIVLAFCEWIPYDLEYHDVDKESICVEKNFISKLRFTGFGVGLALFTVIIRITLGH